MSGPVSAALTEPMVPIPDRGRLFPGAARVRLSDATPSGRVRFDAVARYLQDVAADDAEDAGLDEDRAWVVRRTVLETSRSPQLGDHLDLVTFCGGYGSRWAERRTRIAGPGGALVDAAALWVCLDRAGRPVPVSERFVAAYEGAARAAGSRRISARLRHPDPSDVGSMHDVDAWTWAIRTSDLDVLGHVNNAATWEVVEEAMERYGNPRWRRAEMEYRNPLNPGDEVTVQSMARDRAVWVWLQVEGETRASAVVTDAPGPGAD